MTRINVVPVEELHHKHLVAEYREITRPFAKVRARQQKGQKPRDIKAPSDYVLGTGHETFFFTRLQYLVDRYESLVAEMRRRGYTANPVSIESLTNGIDKQWMGTYSPSPEALRLNRERIKQRLEGL